MGKVHHHRHQMVKDVSFPFQDWECVVEVCQPMSWERIAVANDLWETATETLSFFERQARGEPDMMYR